MDETRWYCIKVKGSVPDGWADRLGGLTSRPGTGPDGEPITVLEGKLRDQAALAGVCDTLYQFHLPIIEISSHLDDAPVNTANEEEMTE